MAGRGVRRASALVSWVGLLPVGGALSVDVEGPHLSGARVPVGQPLELAVTVWTTLDDGCVGDVHVYLRAETPSFVRSGLSPSNGAATPVVGQEGTHRFASKWTLTVEVSAPAFRAWNATLYAYAEPCHRGSRASGNATVLFVTDFIAAMRATPREAERSVVVGRSVDFELFVENLSNGPVQVTTALEPVDAGAPIRLQPPLDTLLESRWFSGDAARTNGTLRVGFRADRDGSWPFVARLTARPDTSDWGTLDNETVLVPLRGIAWASYAPAPGALVAALVFVMAGRRWAHRRRAQT